DRSGAEAMGHMLGPQSILSAPVRATGIALDGARFEQRPDPETNFQLLAAVATGGEAGEALLVTLRPNQDVCEALARICTEAGFARASIHGIGSFNGARFEDGAEMTSFASEFLVTEGRFDAAAEAPLRLEVAVVGLDGQIFRGPLVPGAAPVCVTCEFVLLREAAG
ncbi:DNA-binding protein, partial [Thioclava sp. BHET1]